MKSIQAIVAGSFFIIVVNLLLQLVFLLVIVEYNTLSKEVHFFKGIGEYSRVLIALPAFLFVMFLGGVITANIAPSRVLLHCAIVSAITLLAMILPLLSSTELTLTGIILSTLSILAVIAGGWYWKKRSVTCQNTSKPCAMEQK